MKKLIMTAAAVFAFGFSNGQEVKFGAKGDVNFSNFGGDVQNSSMKVGFNVGAFAEIELSDKFSVQPELLYTTAGNKQESSITVLGITTTTKTEADYAYLLLPVMAKYYVVNKLSLQAGPQLGVLLKANQINERTVSNLVNKTTVDVKNTLNELDFSMNLGAGLDFTDHLGASVRYSLGLTSISKNTNASITNKIIAVGLNYKF